MRPYLWTVCFGLISLILFEQAMKRRDQEYSLLLERKLHWQREKEHALFLHEKLLQQVNSESDPDWIELTLMKQLGLSPEGYTKVFFSADLPR